MNSSINSYNTAGLQCPNLSDSRMMIKFVDPGRLGVVMGPRLMGCLCLKGYFEVINKFFTSSITIKSGETQRLELGNTADYGYRRDTRVFTVSSAITYDQTVTAHIGTASQTETFTFSSGTTMDTFVSNLRAKLNASTFLKPNFEVSAYDKTNKTIDFRTIKNGITMVCEFLLDTQPLPFTQIYTPVRYDRGRCRFIFLLVDYDEFTAPIPDSDKKHLLYAFDDDYQDNILDSPEDIAWRRIGKMYANSSDQDIIESDENLIETIWLKNDLDYDVTLQVLLAS